MATPGKGWILSQKIQHFIVLLCISHLVSAQIRYSIPEEMKPRSVVGNIAEDLGLEKRELSARKCRLVFDNGKQYLEVNPENGILFVNERIDRERLCDDSSTCFISFEVLIENPLEMYRVEVEILDINDNSPSFPEGGFALRVAENIAPGARFPLESAHDPDVGANTVSTYQISANDFFSLKVQTRSGGMKVVELLLEKPLDREEQSTIQLVLTAVDGGNPQRTGKASITISVLDINDNVPIFDHEVYKVSLRENAPVGTFVIKVNAVDSDEGTNAEVTYSFSNRASLHVRELFSLDSKSGEITVKGVLDFEKSPVYEFDVQAVDQGSPPMAGHSSVHLRLIDVNDNAPKIQLTSVSSSVQEDAAPGTVIAVISVTDADSGPNAQVNCQLPTNVPFKLQKMPGNQFKLVTSDRLDREKLYAYNISILAWDSGSPPLSSTKTLLVTVSDINDNAPRFDQPSYTAYVMENNTPGDSILSVTALDLDSDQNSFVSYSILENHIEEMMSFPYISVDSKSGNVYALRSFDYEQLKNFQLQVQARDSGSPPLSSSAAVNVIILDQNDNAPVVVSPVTRNGSATVDPVPQSAPAGYLVTKVMATDADSGQNARLSYQLLKATDPSLFSLGRNSGEIRVISGLLGRDGTKQSLVVLIRDNGQPSLSATVTVIVSIMANVTRHEFEHSNLLPQSENSSDLNLYLIITFASTSFVFLLTILVLVAIKCHQDHSVADGYTSKFCCCRWRDSHEAYPGRSAQRESLNYDGVMQSATIPGSYSYKYCLSPESAKSDFLFLKACNSSLPQNTLRITDNNASKLNCS